MTDERYELLSERDDEAVEDTAKRRKGKHNRYMFALHEPPSEQLAVAGEDYRLVRVFKHDFWAATSLYQAIRGVEAKFPRIVVKFGRVGDFAGIPLRWIGRYMQVHEESIHRVLDGLEGVPRWISRIGDIGYAMEYVEGKPLDHFDKPPKGYFDRMRAVFDAVHERGVAYVDANKRSNMIVGPNGEAFLIDFQISLRLQDNLPWPLRATVRQLIEYMKDKDIYHLYKHKRRMEPEELTEEESQLSRRQGRLHALHGGIAKHYRTLRRKLLRKQFLSGRLVSPTVDMEDHYQPERIPGEKRTTNQRKPINAPSNTTADDTTRQ
jgi:hypothetical protein